MKLAINQNTLMQGDLTEFIDVCAHLGLHAVEVSYPKAKEILRFLSPDRVSDMLQERKMEVLALNAFEDALLVPQQGVNLMVAEARLVGEICAAIGCPAVVIPSSRWYPPYGALPPPDLVDQLYVDKLSRIRGVPSDYGVEALFESIDEPPFVVGRVERTDNILSAAELDGMRVVVDVHNLHRGGPEQLRQLRSRIGMVHLDDTRRPSD